MERRFARLLALTGLLAVVLATGCATAFSRESPPAVRGYQEYWDSIAAWYPKELREAGIGGTARVWLDLDAGGNPQDARIAETTGHAALDDLAVRAARVLDFWPGALDGDPIATETVVPVTFHARGGDVLTVPVLDGRSYRDAVTQVLLADFFGTGQGSVGDRVREQPAAPRPRAGAYAVEFRVTVGEDGRLSNPVITASSGFAKFDAIVLRHVHLLRVTRAMLNGEPVAFVVFVPYTLEIR